MKHKNRLSVKALLFLITALLLQFNLGMTCFALPSFTVEQDSVFSARQGDKNVNLQVLFSNTGSEEISIKGVISEVSGISVKTGTSTATISGSDSENLSFTVDIDSDADEGDYRIPLLITDTSDESVLKTLNIELSVYEKSSTIPGSTVYVPSVDIDHIISGSETVTSGSETTLSLSLFNRGNTILKGSKITLTVPDGFSIVNSSNTWNIGYLSIGGKASGGFTLTAEENIDSKTYPVTITLTGLDQGNTSYSTEQTVYMKGSGDKTSHSIEDIQICNISAPENVKENIDFTLGFDVFNESSEDSGNLKITAEMPDGIVNKTKNSFVVTSLAAGAKQHFSITLCSTDSIEEGFYNIKISVSPLNSEQTHVVEQYAGTFVTVEKKTSDGAIHKPQLMVSDYSYGGSYVPAGSNFPLSLTLHNTSMSVNMSNIKVTVTSEDGTFIPVGSSNSFYIQSLAANSTINKTLTMTTRNDAEQKTASLTVIMTYEDGSANSFDSADIISVPVLQDDRLMIDDIMPPTEIYAGMPSSTSVNFYNMGKTTLNSLRVDVSGDFEAYESNMYFVGNMESGKSDSFDFAFTPYNSGIMNGVITFTYENASGQELTLERPFQFDVMESLPIEEYPDEGIDEEPTKPHYWVIWAAAGVVVLAVISGVLIAKRRKKKKAAQLDIDEDEFDFDDNDAAEDADAADNPAEASLSTAADDEPEHDA